MPWFPVLIAPQGPVVPWQLYPPVTTLSAYDNELTSPLPLRSFAFIHSPTNNTNQA